MATEQMPSRYRAAVVAHLMVDGAERAMDFYAEAFGATQVLKIADSEGTVLHAEMSISGSVFMVGDADVPFTSPMGAGSASVGLHVYVNDVDALGERAARAGAAVLQQPTDMFYGDRSIMLRDPFGHLWVFLTHQEDLSTAEIERRGNELLTTAAES